MSQILISATLPDEDAASLQQNLAALKEKLGFLLNLQTEDVVTLLKAGKAHMSSIKKAYQTIQGLKKL